MKIRVPYERVDYILGQFNQVLTPEIANILIDRLDLESELKSTRLNHDMLVTSNAKLAAELRCSGIS